MISRVKTRAGINNKTQRNNNLPGGKVEIPGASTGIIEMYKINSVDGGLSLSGHRDEYMEGKRRVTSSVEKFDRVSSSDSAARNRTEEGEA